MKIAHRSLLAATSLVVASLGLGTYLAAVDAAWNSPNIGPSVIAAHATRDEMGRPTCRRKTSAIRSGRSSGSGRTVRNYL